MNLFKPDLNSNQDNKDNKIEVPKYFEYKGDVWDFTFVGYEGKTKIQEAKDKLLKKITTELKKSQKGKLEGNSEELIRGYLTDFFKFIKLAYNIKKLLIVNQEEDSQNYPQKLLYKTESFKEAAYDYFLKYVFGLLLGYSINEENVDEKRDIPLSPTIVLERIKLFLDEYKVPSF